MTQRILITGANGLLGKKLCGILSEKNHHVYAFIRPGTKWEPKKNVDFIEADLSNSFLLEHIEPIDTIFHLAQASGHNHFAQSANQIINVTAGALSKLCEFAHRTGVKRVVFTSSGGVYGGGAEPFLETTSLPEISSNLYIETKKFSEKILSFYDKFFQTIILRPFFIYGPNQRPELLFPRLKQSIKEGKAISVASGQGPNMNPIYVDDAAKAAAACIEGDLPKVINLAGNEILSLRKICQLLGDAAEIPPLFSEPPEAPMSFIGNNELMRKYLHNPEISIQEGVKKVQEN